MQVFWTQTAEADLDEIVQYIAEESVVNALAFDERIRDRARILADFPEAGRVGRVNDTREIAAPHDRCVVVYRIAGDLVQVLRVMHGGRDWPLDEKTHSPGPC